MKDRFTTGFVAGFVGGLAPFVFNFSSRALGFTTLVWADFMGFYIFGRKATGGGAAEMVFAIGAQFVLLGILGSIFSLILPHITSHRHLFKGALYGTVIWFISFSIPYLLQLPELSVIPLKTAISNLIGASLWGIALAFILKRLDNKVSQ